ncbi:MAG TPA: WD40 repeat domain-containing protein [Candidatus Sulfotelmatobacter sp.]|nr:WD40 repeat domain-containing protein [Candidatus Sulfotelmatobacter sp.]
MGRLHWVRYAFVVVTIFLFSLLPACGGHKPPGSNPFPAKITLNPTTSASMQAGSTMVFSASAQNGTNAAISPTFTFTSSNPGVVDISPAGAACAGSWNAPYYSVCTPAGIGQAEITASALGATSPPTVVFVHPPIDAITVTVVPPVNPPPPACPSQTELPAECKIAFNTQAANYCVSQNQVQTLQATAYSNGVDITATVGPFTWSQTNLNVVTITPIVTSANSSSVNVPTNQATVVSNTPGETQVIASASGVSSSPQIAETCPVQCISLQLGTNGSQNIGTTSFVANKGTSETITATAVDVQGCVVPKPPLTWTSTAPAAATAGSVTAGCTAGTTCTIATTQPGAAAITASCTPPTCNVGFPLNPQNAGGLPALYFPQPIFPVTAISGLVSGATTAASVLASSQDCYSNSVCSVALYDVSTATNVAGTPSSMPTPPNSLMFDPGGDKAYAGSQYGSFLITTANIGSASTSPFTFLPAAATPLGLVTGRVLAVSPNGNLAVFSDTISTPNQVYVVNTASSSASTFLNINSATTAAFSPDNSKAFILGDAGNTLYVYSPLQALQSYPLTAPADAIAFSSTGAFAFIAGGTSGSNVTVLNTCNNQPATSPAPATGTFSITGLPATPIFLKMVPPGNVPMGNAIFPTPLQSEGLDILLGVDNTGIDVIATSSTTPLTVTPTTSLCPLQQIALATIVSPTTFTPIHIDLQRGTFHPLSFFLSPDASKTYIVTSDQGVLVYSFSTQTTSAIPLNGNAAPLAADMTVDGTLLYVAGSDGLLHELNTLLALDQMDVQFLQLSDSSNNFCYSSYSCALNLVAVKP